MKNRLSVSTYKPPEKFAFLSALSMVEICHFMGVVNRPETAGPRDVCLP